MLKMRNLFEGTNEEDYLCRNVLDDFYANKHFTEAGSYCLYYRTYGGKPYTIVSWGDLFCGDPSAKHRSLPWVFEGRVSPEQVLTFVADRSEDRPGRGDDVFMYEYPEQGEPCGDTTSACPSCGSSYRFVIWARGVKLPWCHECQHGIDEINKLLPPNREEQ